jgi:hypothetical protein
MRFSFLVLSMSVVGALVACGGSDAAPEGDNTPYTTDPNKTVVVGGAEGPSGAQTGDCIRLPSGECADAKECKAGERRDVVIDSAGKVVAVVCYPGDAEPPTIDSDGNVELGQTDNNGVVSVGQIGGDVSAAGNNITVYGRGPDVSVIAGNVEATGNNFSLRGVRVKGDVKISGGNNAALVLCVVEGNVHIVGNNNVIADCDVLGNIVIEGVNNTLVANHVGGKIQITDAKNSVCDGNLAWDDANGNKIVDPGEPGAPLTCDEK